MDITLDLTQLWISFSGGSQLLDLFENYFRAIWDIVLSLNLNDVVLLKIF